MDNVTARGRTNFSIGLKAVDPIKYELVGNDVESNNVTTIGMNASAVTITNNGNTKVPVVFEIEGALTASPAAPATITLTSSDPDKRIFIVESQSQSGDVLEIDTYKREVLFNGQGFETGVGASRRRLSTLVDWIELEPGVNTITWTGTGTATCSILYRSGWIG
jgi:phage-related protein